MAIAKSRCLSLEQDDGQEGGRGGEEYYSDIVERTWTERLVETGREWEWEERE